MVVLTGVVEVVMSRVLKYSVGKIFLEFLRRHPCWMETRKISDNANCDNKVKSSRNDGADVDTVSDQNIHIKLLCLLFMHNISRINAFFCHCQHDIFVDINIIQKL